MRPLKKDLRSGMLKRTQEPGERSKCLAGKGISGLLFTALMLAPATMPIIAQTTSPAPLIEKHVTPSLAHLYWHMMMHQNHLDRSAAVREQQGKDGNWLRHYYQQKLGFTDSEFQPVRDTAQRLETELKQINDRVKAVVAADRASHPRTLSNPADLPPPIPELAQLGQQHEAVLQNEMDKLRKALGPKHSAKLDAFLQKDFAPNVTIRLVSPPQAHVPSRQPAPPFPVEVQP